MNQLNALMSSEYPELCDSITLAQTLLCVAVNPCMHAVELERCGVLAEPERRAIKTGLERELQELIDLIPAPVPELFFDFINALQF